MKNLLFLAVLFFGLSSCTKDTVELEVEQQTNLEKEENLLAELDSRSTWPMGAYDLVDFMNARNYTNSKYIGCNDNLIDLSFSGGNSTDVSDPYGPLSSRPHEDLYSISDFGSIVHTLWDKIKAECDGDAVIVDVEFRVGFFTPEGDYNYYIDAFVTVCCDPILEDVQLPDPTVLFDKER
jgi:hypothetical protein